MKFFIGGGYLVPLRHLLSIVVTILVELVKVRHDVKGCEVNFGYQCSGSVRYRPQGGNDRFFRRGIPKERLHYF